MPAGTGAIDAKKVADDTHCLRNAGACNCGWVPAEIKRRQRRWRQSRSRQRRSRRRDRDLCPNRPSGKVQAGRKGKVGCFHRRKRMTLLLPTLAASFAAFCVWLTLRIVNRKERWAKWTM